MALSADPLGDLKLAAQGVEANQTAAQFESPKQRHLAVLPAGLLDCERQAAHLRGKPADLMNRPRGAPGWHMLSVAERRQRLADRREGSHDEGLKPNPIKSIKTSKSTNISLVCMF